MSVHLMNGHKEPRTRSSDGCAVLDCGCAYTDKEYVQMCGPDFAEWERRHDSARVDHTYGST